MRKLAQRIVLLACVSLAGCTNTLYQAETAGLDTGGNQRNFILYWTKTDQLLGTTKAGPAILLTECSSARPEFVNADEGIVFFGAQGFDRIPGEPAPGNAKFPCGKIPGFGHLRDVPAGTIQLIMSCEPVADEFAVTSRNYLAPHPQPYVLNVEEKQREWNFLGQSLAAPQTPPCRDDRIRP